MISDRFIMEFDRALRTLCAPASTVREVPGNSEAESVMSEAEKAHAAALMRVNHVGEICAQALYQGQALTSRQDGIRRALEQAAREETEHLAWTERRLAELGSRTSLLNPFWYLGALAIGVVAGKLGDDWSLGFLAETERQVEAHLDSHLSELPEQDKRSRAIVAQMRSDEIAHAETAMHLGARELPPPAIVAMRLAARAMTRTAYYV
ncbi:2-polyprenyl-3-methyl-6-methoxy-1,4-benzoquinone monooxygenase [Accumulibacter sp.]|uniref:2-polyprenyl-3-methyl-6-methoxy-1,4-benzoquinone monooxygenase n=1 Tax=Accumulibacter sp. TaxID=2053492 RepID=UPI0025E679F3|nr:2-polyprenyl-3-methyl-6-methoxy-1,4-benzoquinone monooxygenase [Accumulibacter sp.]MCM8612324.1 2-polyprenyl-3-methyl-6-methoxy-1,4-benzoquinone monooxygenase [Accumulibacter sp.]MCM8636313.1 2-polyprenyl-3-methyl-6-methoxy-1,4-benzoquinone monooxygenase [Accumulibacter sp.]MCM8640000.1 2-polyprenyl-3-methyl-6-methoxy-1,4-benzoquinone monooxygenase [Accumulibacter sp.]